MKNRKLILSAIAIIALLLLSFNLPTKAIDACTFKAFKYICGAILLAFILNKTEI